MGSGIIVMSRRKRTLAILDVGHGNCAVLIDSKGVAVIDTGAGSTLLEYLSEQKIKRIDVVFLSHADKDHIGGLAQLLASKVVQVSRICLNCDASKGSDIWDDLVYELNKADNAGTLKFETSLVEDDSGRYDQGTVRIRILSPSKYLAAKGAGGSDRKGRKITSNSLSAVILLNQGTKPIALFPGDVDEVGIDDIVANGVDATSPVLVFPHHGGRSGAGDLETFVKKLCGLVSPSTVLFSMARGRDKHPLPQLFPLLRKYLKHVRLACTQLSEHCARITAPAKPKHLQNVFAQGREKKRCCAGTFVIRLSDPATINPTYPTHQAFIRAHAPSALCRTA